MKFITPIQSFSDIITNSSSEVFLMNKENADYFDSMNNGCISILLISSLDDIKFYWYYSDLLCNYLGVTWDKLIEDKSNWEKLIGLYIVNIEDHFENCDEVYGEARSSCFASH